MTLPLGFDAIKIVDCQTLCNKYRHYKLPFQEQTLCNRVLLNFDLPPFSRRVCPECRLALQWLNKVRPEGKVDTLKALQGKFVGPLAGRR